MAIYTKGGDKGETSLFDGTRVLKDSLRVGTYGTSDELNTNISLADKSCESKRNKRLLQEVEYKMFSLQGETATEKRQYFTDKSKIIIDEDTRRSEKVIDEHTAKLPPVHSFILPGSNTAGVQLHVCWIICRRTERLFVRLSKDVKSRPELEQYVNRLSDFLYIVARDEDYEDLLNTVTDDVIKIYQCYQEKRDVR